MEGREQSLYKPVPLANGVPDTHPDQALSSSEQADFMPAIWNALDIDGSRYALPSDNAQYGLYYNRALFDAWNAAHPDQFIPYPSADWTWNDLRNAARLLTQRDASGSITHYGIAFDLWSWPFLSFFAQAGGEIWNEDHTTTFINGPEGLRALDFIIDLIPPDAPVRSPELAESAAGPASLFAAGRVAILLDGSWRAPNLELTSPDLDFAIAPLPRDRRRAVMSGSVLWAVGAHSQHPQDAWRMIRWMTGPEQSLRYWEALRVAPPARLSIVSSPTFRETPGLTDADGTLRVPPMHEDDFNDRAAWLVHGMTPDPETGSPPAFIPTGPYQADLENLIASALVAAVRGRLSPQQALDDAADSLHRIIDRDRAARGLPAVSR